MEIEKINGRTPEEIKANLKQCSKVSGCAGCENLGDLGCVEWNMRYALALIEHLESERNAALAKVPKWISVEERLPDAFVSVLVQMPGEVPHPTVREGFISNDGIWYAGHFNREPDEVTHWAKMPEPPKRRNAI